MSLLLEALSYARHGWHVFPLRPRGKEPLTEHGFKNATTNPEQIIEWWSRFPEANIGVATGKQSGIVVIDVDPRNGGDVHEFVRTMNITKMCTAITGSDGRHIYFRYPPTADVLPCRSEFVPGIDFKADGGYVVAPPSIHPNGTAYEWSA